MTAQEVHAKMAAIGMRIFKITLQIGSRTDEEFWIHPNKTTEQWRKDFNDFLNKSCFYDNLQQDQLSLKEYIEEGYADDFLYNALHCHLSDLGYHELDDVISDVYEGRVTNEKAQLVKHPAHDEQETGFGHYGWESKLLSDK